MHNEPAVETCLRGLRSTDSAVRARAADGATDGVSDWGHHSYTEPQAQQVTQALVDALAVESEVSARESLINALATFVVWDLAPVIEVARAIALPRPATDPREGYWTDIEEWARRHEPRA